MHKPLSVKNIFLIITLLIVNLVTAQSNSYLDIIQKIYDLEKNRDPKCYATANRLEDFMYGTPLDEEARNYKIDIQKEIIYYLKEKGTENALQDNSTKIKVKHIQPILKDLANYYNTDNGDYIYLLNAVPVTILKKDYDHYASVSYGYRSLLSVEQDLIFTDSELLSFDSEALELTNQFINLITLVTLKVADINARVGNDYIITKNRLLNTWIKIIEDSNNQSDLAKVSYPKATKNNSLTKTNYNFLLKKIIEQKIASYEVYNNLTESVFLRNLQVYFARQKWPSDLEISNNLRTYYMESLIDFTTSLLQHSHEYSLVSDNQIIRAKDVQLALDSFLPSYTNIFEDVTFFPNNDSDKINIESYDLDAFRDSGFHWRILGYALDDLRNLEVKSVDPIAAELMVEGIAQMGVLVLRFAGEQSNLKGKKVLDIDDIVQSFVKIQDLISTYDFNKPRFANTPIKSSSLVEKKLFQISLLLMMKRESFLNINRRTGLTD